MKNEAKSKKGIGSERYRVWKEEMKMDGRVRGMFAEGSARGRFWVAGGNATASELMPKVEAQHREQFKSSHLCSSEWLVLSANSIKSRASLLG